jgi:hypothetical protein
MSGSGSSKGRDESKGGNASSGSGIGRRVRAAGQPWERLDREIAEVAEQWRGQEAALVEAVLAETDRVIEGAHGYLRRMPDYDDPDRRFLFHLVKARLEVALQVSGAVREAQDHAEAEGRDVAQAGYEALLSAGSVQTPEAVGALMSLDQGRLAELATYLLAGGVAKHISLVRNPSLAAFFRSQSQRPQEGLHEELPAGLLVAYAERQPASGPLLAKGFIKSVIDAIMGSRVSGKELLFSEAGEGTTGSGIADRPNPFLPKDAPVNTQVPALQSQGDLPGWVQAARLSAGEREIFDLLMQDPSLFDHGGNKEIAGLLGRSPSQIGVEKKRLLDKIQKAFSLQSEPQQSEPQQSEFQPGGDAR